MLVCWRVATEATAGTRSLNASLEEFEPSQNPATLLMSQKMDTVLHMFQNTHWV